MENSPRMVGTIAAPWINGGDLCDVGYVGSIYVLDVVPNLR